MEEKLTEDIIKNEELKIVEDIPQETVDNKNKILLISLLVIIFIVSIGVIAWVVTSENHFREDELKVLRNPQKVEKEYVAKNENQETLLSFKEELVSMESDIWEFYSIMNDNVVDTYGELMIMR